MTTNIDRAADFIARCWPNGRGIRKDDAAELARELHEAGLLMPALPVVCVDATEDMVTTFHNRIGCTAPISVYAPQIITIHGDEDASDVTLNFSDRRMSAVTPEQLDSLIAALIAARTHRNHKENINMRRTEQEAGRDA